MVPSNGNAFERLRREAKRLLKDVQSGDEAALRRFTQYWPATGPSGEVRNLARTQLVIARERGYRSWAHLKTSLLPKKERVMETQLCTRPYSSKTDVYNIPQLKWDVKAQSFTKGCKDTCLTTVERITMMLHDEAFRDPQNPNSAGFAPCLVYMSVEEAEQLQAQLAKAIAERRRADAEAKGKGSDKSS